MSISFGDWPSDIHYGYDQENRIFSAKKSATTPLSIDKDSCTGVFPGSGKHPYQVTLNSCTCVDFSRRKLPCKHIYRLAMECGLMEGDYCVGVNKNIAYYGQLSWQTSVDEIENLTDECQQILLPHLSPANLNAENYFFLLEMCDEIRPLLDCRLLTHELASAEIVLIEMSITTLRNYANKIDQTNDKPKSFRSKKDLAEFCARHTDELDPPLPETILFRFSPDFKKGRTTAFKYLRRKFEWDIDTDWETNKCYRVPYGSKHEWGSEDPKYYFPDDYITAALNKYKCNRCKDGYDPGPSVGEAW